MAAAVAAGEEAYRRGQDLRITVFESSDRVGRTILATGNGRCNFSNSHIDSALYHNSEFATQVLDHFESFMNCDSSRDKVDADGRANGTEGAIGGTDIAPVFNFPNSVVRFFFEHGMLWREEGEGRLYPQANKASVVLDVLRHGAAAVDAVERVDTRIEQIEAPRSEGKPFTLRTSEGVFERADAAIVACGGKIARSILGNLADSADPIYCANSNLKPYRHRGERSP